MSKSNTIPAAAHVAATGTSTPFDLPAPEAEDPAVLAEALESWVTLYPYICFGAPGLATSNPFRAGLRPTIYCTPDITGVTTDPESWTDAQLAGDVWTAVVCFMGEQRIPLRMPNWPLLISEVKKWSGTKRELRSLTLVFSNGSHILSHLMRNTSAAAEVDETFINKPLVRNHLTFMDRLTQKEWDKLGGLVLEIDAYEVKLRKAHPGVD